MTPMSSAKMLLQAIENYDISKSRAFIEFYLIYCTFKMKETAFLVRHYKIVLN